MTAEAVDPDDTTHSHWCVLYCGGGCDEQHYCWCAEGHLSAAEFAERHPHWFRMYYLRWLDTDEGTAWLHAMGEPPV